MAQGLDGVYLDLHGAAVAEQHRARFHRAGEVEELLDAQMAVAPNRFRGIRVSAALDPAAPKAGFNIAFRLRSKSRSTNCEQRRTL